MRASATSEVLGGRSTGFEDAQEQHLRIRIPESAAGSVVKIASTGATSTRKSRALELFSRTMRFKQWEAAMCTCSSTAPPLIGGLTKVQTSMDHDMWLTGGGHGGTQRSD